MEASVVFLQTKLLLCLLATGCATSIFDRLCVFVCLLPPYDYLIVLHFRQNELKSYLLTYLLHGAESCLSSQLVKKFLAVCGT